MNSKFIGPGPSQAEHLSEADLFILSVGHNQVVNDKLIIFFQEWNNIGNKINIALTNKLKQIESS